MANLPDLDTANAGLVAYWNALDDGGLSDFAPNEALSDTRIGSYTLYDNGFTATYNTITGRNATVRVKQDGWFVVYFDRTAEYQTNQTDAPRGPWDLVNKWTAYNSGTAPTVTDHSLERAINSLMSELSNSGSVTYDAADVGLYDFGNSGATNLTMLSFYTDVDDTYGFSYTAGTTREHHSVFTRNRNDNTINSFYGTTTFDGVDLATSDNSGNAFYGTYDVIGNGAAPSDSTEYQTTVDTNVTGADVGRDFVEVSGGTLVMWS